MQKKFLLVALSLISLTIQSMEYLSTIESRKRKRDEQSLKIGEYCDLRLKTENKDEGKENYKDISRTIAEFAMPDSYKEKLISWLQNDVVKKGNETLCYWRDGYSAQFSPSENYIAINTDSYVDIYRIDTNEKIFTYDADDETIKVVSFINNSHVVKITFDSQEVKYFRSYSGLELEAEDCIVEKKQKHDNTVDYSDAKKLAQELVGSEIIIKMSDDYCLYKEHWSVYCRLLNLKEYKALRAALLEPITSLQTVALLNIMFREKIRVGRLEAGQRALFDAHVPEITKKAITDLLG